MQNEDGLRQDALIAHTSTTLRRSCRRGQSPEPLSSSFIILHLSPLPDPKHFRVKRNGLPYVLVPIVPRVAAGELAVFVGDVQAGQLGMEMPVASQQVVFRPAVEQQ